MLGKATAANKPRLSFDFRDDLTRAGVIDEVGAGIIRYLAYYRSHVSIYLTIQGDHSSGKKLTSLDPAISQLKKLERLDLSNNQLTELPAEIGQLTSLEELILSDNQLTCLSEKLLPWWQQILNECKYSVNSPWLQAGDLISIGLDALIQCAKRSVESLQQFCIKMRNIGRIKINRSSGCYEQRHLFTFMGSIQNRCIVFFEDDIPFYLDRQLSSQKDVDKMLQDLAEKPLFRVP